jgi:uncharacterized protein YybS (DUF2232 family)
MVNTEPGLKNFFSHPGRLLLFSAFFFAPALSPSLLGWLNGLFAVPVFYLLTVNGFRSGLTTLHISLVIAGIGALLMHRLDFFLFSLTVIPLGYSLFKSAANQESAAVSGGKGVAVLGLTWLIFWGVYGAVMGINPYKQLIEMLDLGFQQSLVFYTSKEAGLPPEMMFALQEVISGLRKAMPALLPGLLASALVITVLVNMIVSNTLANYFSKGVFPWGAYSTWELPEQLVWVPITAITLMLIGKGDLLHTGGWLLMLSGLLYFFQGLAIFIALLERWNVPVYIKGILYFILIIQSYGLLILALLGISDIWFNFRKRIEER